MRRTLPLLVLLALAGIAPARAAAWTYTISVPDGREATFELPFPVEYAGTVTLEAAWTGPRLLFFGVDGPGRAPVARRSGPSPQRMELTAPEPAASGGTGWTLTIKAIPARGEASGRLTLTVPDAPAIVARREAELHPPPPPPPPPPSWMVAKAAPEGATPEVARVYEAVEALRAVVVKTAESSGDACGWQLGFLTYAAAARDRLPGAAAPLDAATLRYFARMAEAIRNVELLRSGTDRVIAGPVPADRDDRREWLIERNEIVRPIEHSLDRLAELIRGGQAPALEDERWPPRLTACLTACERFYDERVRLGGEDDAPNKELAAAQWDRILAAQKVLEAFAPFLKEPQAP